MYTMRNGERLYASIFLVFAMLLPIIQGQTPQCLDNGNYTANSSYQTNLNTALSSLPTDVNRFGFAVARQGRVVNALALCRGDTQPDTCRSCIRNATSLLLSACPYQRQAIMWHELCMLRYSDMSIFGILDNEVSRVLLCNTQDSRDLTQVIAALRTLIDNLRTQAASGGPFLKMAAANTTVPGFQTIYGMVMCTPDLSMEDCNTCLNNAFEDLREGCYGYLGANSLWASCNVRYESYTFFNANRIQELTAMSLPSPPPQPQPQPPPPPPPGSNDRSATRIIIIVAVSVILGIILVVSVSFLISKKMRQKPNEEIQCEDDDGNEISVTDQYLQYDFGKIRAATNDFSEANKLGQGGFGVVYKGKLLNGQEIAVKRLSRNSGQGNMEFKNEVMLLARLQHRHLVRLKGFSLEGTEKLLVYEFIENASLDHFIFDPVKRSYLDWDIRYKIITGIARGLLYLHEDSRLKIIHRDLKAGNILLDGEMNPKIADFGMARLFVPDETQGITNRIVGTYGYMAPEYAMHGQFSVKSDVFSFGVLVLEIISGQRNNSFRNGDNIEEDLISSAWRSWRDGAATTLIDPALRVGSSSIPRDILKCIHIALLCVQENAVDRPTMASVVLMFNVFSITLAIPSEPAFYMRSDSQSEVPLISKELSSENDSQNEVTITELDPR